MGWQENYRNWLGENLERIAQGSVKMRRQRLTLSSSCLDFVVAAGERSDLRLTIKSDSQEVVSGIIVCNNSRFTLSANDFMASEFTVTCSFDSTGLRQGDMVRAYVYIISEAGEIQRDLPGNGAESGDHLISRQA